MTLEEYKDEERLKMIIAILGFITNGEWEQIKEREPSLHKFIKQAVNR